MSLRLEVKKLMLERSPRVKAMDFHPHNSWVVFGLYSGTLSLYDYSTNTCIRTLQVSTFPIRAIKFIPQKNLIVCGSDDFKLSVFNYNTMEKVKSIEAHGDFIRAIIVHPSEPFVITASDDAKIKIWNHDKDFSLVRTLDEHKHFVMALAFNPKDLTKFGSTSMDKTIKIWNLTTEGKANFTLTGHKGSVNCIDFYKGDKPHLASGSDDHSIKIWDYQTRQCLHTIDSSYKQAVTSVNYHPELPLLLTTAEDGPALIFHSSTFNLMNSLEYNLGMGWSSGFGQENRNILALGFDEGSVVVKIGSDEPVVDIHNGKILFTKNMQVYMSNLKAVSYQEQERGHSLSPEQIFPSPKQLGSTDIYPTSISYSPNGHYFGVSNTKQFAIIKVASFKTVCLGNGSQVTWFNESDFVVVQNDTLHQYVGMEYMSSSRQPIVPERLFGGGLLSVVSKDIVLMYSWENLSKPLHKLQIQAQKVVWSPSLTQVMISTGQSFTLYTYNSKNHSLTEMITVSDQLTSCCFVNEIFYYMTRSGKIYFVLYDKSFFYTTTSDKRQFILSGMKHQNRLYLMDRGMGVFGVYVPFELVEEVARYVRNETKQQPVVAEEFKNIVAKCYHAFGLGKQAYRLTSNVEHKFELALSLGYTRDAYKLAISNNMSAKIKLIGDLSLKKGEIELAIDCYERIDDLTTLLMIYSSLQLGDRLERLALKAQRMTRMNVAYMCYYLTGQRDKCVDVLIKSKRFPEAALFARTYCSQRIGECVSLWRESLADKGIADKIADPTLEQEEDNQEEDEEVQNQQQESLI